MNFFNVLQFSALAILIYMTVWFLLACIIKRNDVADIAWGLGFALLSWLLFFKNGSGNITALIANILVSIWGLRLALHIFSRNKNKPEDFRYKNWRDTWGKWFYLRSYLQIFVLQGILLLLISTSIIAINSSIRTNFGLITVLGIIVWLVGFIFEAVGDSQLQKFISDPQNKGKVMEFGLWAYTRHPNYFGEVTQWWGIWLMTFYSGNFWIALISPLTITFLILKVSGIPMLEKKYDGNPNYQAYKLRTSAFFPLPKKHD